MLGFWSTLKITYNKEKYIQKYFEIIPEAMNNEPKEIGREFLDNIPHYVSICRLIENLKIIKKKVNPEHIFHINNIEKKIYDLEK